MNCGWDNLSNTTVCLKCGQPLRMPENYANSQDIFISKEGHGEAIPKPTVLNVRSNKEKCRKKGKMVDWVLALLREERALNEAGLGAATAKCTVVRRVVILKKV